MRERRGIGLLGLVLVVGVLLVVANLVRQAFAHGLHAVTDGSTAADRAVGLVIGLAPLVLGVVAFASRRTRTRTVDPALLRPSERRELRRSERRATRPKPVDKRYLYPWLVSLGLVWLLSPASGLHTSDESAQQVFERLIPGYIEGLLIGIGVSFVALMIWFVRDRRRTARR